MILRESGRLAGTMTLASRDIAWIVTLVVLMATMGTSCFLLGCCVGRKQHGVVNGRRGAQTSEPSGDAGGTAPDTRARTLMRDAGCAVEQ